MHFHRKPQSACIHLGNSMCLRHLYILLVSSLDLLASTRNQSPDAWWAICINFIVIIILICVSEKANSFRDFSLTLSLCCLCWFCAQYCLIRIYLQWLRCDQIGNSVAFCDQPLQPKRFQYEYRYASEFEKMWNFHKMVIVKIDN